MTGAVQAPSINGLAHRRRQIGEPYHTGRPGGVRRTRRRHDEANLEIDICTVVATVCAVGDVTPDDLFGPRLNPRWCRPRQLAVWCVDRYCPDYSLPQVGKFFRRDHSTMLHAIRSVEDRLLSKHKPTLDMLAEVRARLEAT